KSSSEGTRENSIRLSIIGENFTKKGAILLKILKNNSFP
ncbi:unnamed protein product, partial [Larinioides sclopetarius]